MRIGFVLLWIVLYALGSVHGAFWRKYFEVETSEPEPFVPPTDQLKEVLNIPNFGERLVQGMIEYHNTWRSPTSKQKETHENKLHMVERLEKREADLRGYQESKEFPLPGVKLVSHHTSCSKNIICWLLTLY